MIYKLQKTTQFKKDCKKLSKRGLDLEDLKTIITKLQNGEKLPPRNKDHALVGNHAGFRECHITPDWLLIYCINDNKLIMTCMRTGTHSDLF